MNAWEMTAGKMNIDECMRDNRRGKKSNIDECLRDDRGKSNIDECTRDD